MYIIYKYSVKYNMATAVHVTGLARARLAPPGPFIHIHYHMPSLCVIHVLYVCAVFGVCMWSRRA